MPTLTHINGFEYGICEVGANPTGAGNNRIITTLTTTGGTPAVTTNTPRSGSRCLDIPATSAAASDIRRVFAGGATRTDFVASFAVRFVGSLPTADCIIFCGAAAAGSFPAVIFQASDSTLRPCIGTGTIGSQGFTVTTDTWYLCDFLGDVTATRRARLAVNGTQLTDATSAVAASTMSNWRAGKNVVTTTANGNIRFDDILISETAADYPLGDHEVLGIRPNSDGTHSFTNNDFIQGDAGAGFASSATNMWTFIEEVFAAINTTDSIQQNVIRTTGYMETNYEAAPRTIDAWAVQIHGQYDSDGTGANQVSLRIWDGTTETAIYATIDISDTSVLYRTDCRLTNPSGGAWTQSAIDGLRTRWGFSGDVTGSPILHAIMCEIAYPIVAAPAASPIPFGRAMRIVPLI